MMCENPVLTLLLPCVKFRVKGRGQDHGSVIRDVFGQLCKCSRSAFNYFSCLHTLTQYTFIISGTH